MRSKLLRLSRIAGIALGILGIGGLLAFSARSTNTAPVTGIAVEVATPEGVHFIDENSVRERILASNDAVIGAPLGGIDMVRIEEDLRRIGCVSEANVYHTMDGTLHVKVKQRVPIVRVVLADGSGFYIDREGWTMPLNPTYTARVLVVTGVHPEPFEGTIPFDLVHAPDSLLDRTWCDEVFALASAIVDDPVLDALFDQATVDTRGNIELIPRIGAQRIRIGRLSGIDTDTRRSPAAMRELAATRLGKLGRFYAKGMPQTDWRKYSLIDLRFTDQVVCTRRTDYRPLPANPAPNKRPTTASRN